MRTHLRYALGALFAFAAAAALDWAAALHWSSFSLYDDRALAGFQSLADGHRLEALASWIAHAATPAAYAACIVVLMIGSLVMQRWRLTLAVPVGMVGAMATTEALKHAIVRTSTVPASRFSETFVSAHSWPSGHATGAMSVALWSVLVAPTVLRPLAAVLGAALAVTVGYSVLILGWHFPSDVFGAYLISGAWTALMLLVLLWSAGRRRVPARGVAWAGSRRAALLSAAGALCVLAAAAGLGSAVPSDVRFSGYVVAAASATGAIAVAMAGGLAFAVRPRRIRRSDPVAAHMAPLGSAPPSASGG